MTFSSEYHNSVPLFSFAFTCPRDSTHPKSSRIRNKFFYEAYHSCDHSFGNTIVVALRCPVRSLIPHSRGLIRQFDLAPISPCEACLRRSALTKFYSARAYVQCPLFRRYSAWSRPSPSSKRRSISVLVKNECSLNDTPATRHHYLDSLLIRRDRREAEIDGHGRWAEQHCILPCEQTSHKLSSLRFSSTVARCAEKRH